MALQRSKGRTIRKAQVPAFDSTYSRSSYQSFLSGIGMYYSESSVNTSDSGQDQRWNSQNITPGTVVPYGTTIGINYYVYVYPGFSHYGGFYHGFYHGFAHYAGFAHYSAFAHYGSFAHYSAFAHYAAFGHYSAFSHYGSFGHYSAFGHGYGGFGHSYGGFYHSFGHGYGGFGHYGGFYHGFGHGRRWYSIGSHTGILTPTGSTSAENIKVGDKLLSLNISEIDLANFNPLTWTSESLSGDGVTETEVVSVTSKVVDTVVSVNGDVYSMNHWILSRKDGLVKFTKSSEIDTTYEVYNYQSLDWIPVTSATTMAYIDRVYTINCEPHDMFFTNSMLVYDRVEQPE
jgi:hypothetical protein